MKSLSLKYFSTANFHGNFLGFYEGIIIDPNFRPPPGLTSQKQSALIRSDSETFQLFQCFSLRQNL